MVFGSKFGVILCLAAVVGLSACGRLNADAFKMKNHDMFSTNAGEAQVNAEANMPQKTSSVTALPTQNPSRQSSMHVNVGPIETNSVEIFDMEPIAGYTRDVPQRPFNSNNYGIASRAPAPMVQESSVEVNPISDNYGRGTFANDKSVMIYDLEGQPIQTGFDFTRAASGQAYSSSSDGGASSSYSNARSANQIFFKHGSSRLGSGDMRKISTLSEEAKFAPVDYISVEGFASRPTQAGDNSTEAHIINLRQSMKRSEKVSQALIDKGVPGEKIRTVSWGATKATGNNAFDRRVDINIGGQ